MVLAKKITLSQKLTLQSSKTIAKIIDSFINLYFHHHFSNNQIIFLQTFLKKYPRKSIQHCNSNYQTIIQHPKFQQTKTLISIHASKPTLPHRFHTSPLISIRENIDSNRSNHQEKKESIPSNQSSHLGLNRIPRTLGVSKKRPRVCIGTSPSRAKRIVGEVPKQVSQAVTQLTENSAAFTCVEQIVPTYHWTINSDQLLGGHNSKENHVRTWRRRKWCVSTMEMILEMIQWLKKLEKVLYTKSLYLY